MYGTDDIVFVYVYVVGSFMYLFASFLYVCMYVCICVFKLLLKKCRWNNNE